MAVNNIVLATNTLRTSVKSIKKKVGTLKMSIQALDTELDDIDMKFDKLIVESEIFKAKVEREVKREVRRLEKELETLRKFTGAVAVADHVKVSPEDLKVASTIAIIESILRAVCHGSDDFRLLSYAFLFPAVVERVVKGNEDAYYLEEMPTSADVIVRRGLEYIEWVRSECDTHLTDPEAWELFSSLVSDWWRNDALPLLYGSRDDNWDIDEPLSLLEMVSWRDNVADRPINFSTVFDAYEVYRRFKDEVYKSSGVQDFEIKTFANAGDL